MTDKLDWEGRVGRSWAREWQRTDRSFSGLTDRLLGKASAGGFRRALDIGCGAGEVSLALARGHHGAEVIGIDISADLIEAASERGRNLGNLRFQLADAGSWSEPGFAPDLLVSRHGVMFFADPVATFAHLHAITAPGGRMVFSCFRSVKENEWASRIAGLLPPDGAPPADPSAPGPFAFADPDHVSAILGKAGWAGLDFEPVDFAYVGGLGADALEDAVSYFLTIGPAARAAAGLDGGERQAFIDSLRALLASHLRDDMVTMPAAAWLVTAHRVGG